MRLDGTLEEENHDEIPVHVTATCDQTGYFLAFGAMAEMRERIGRSDDAQANRRRADDLRERANAYLWGGGFYLHHVHLTPSDHPGFDQNAQLAVGNVWAVTRGLADAGQSVSIIDEYRRRHAATGGAYPWWCLQPGYPDALGYFSQLYLKQGGYANGGLLPFVGVELCRGCFQNGREEYGLELLEQYSAHLRRNGGRVHVQYWPDWTAGFRTSNEVPHARWGMAQWMQALLEGLAGVRDASAGLREVDTSPRWAVTGESKATVTVRYAAKESYFAYRAGYEQDRKAVSLEWTGSGERVRFRVLLPAGWETRQLTVDGDEQAFVTEGVEASRYACFRACIRGARSAMIACR